MLLLGSGAAEPAQEAPGFACVSCLVLEVPAAAVDAAALPPGALEGLAVVVVGGDDEHRARLRAAGADVDIAIVDPELTGDIDARVFAARSAATALRAERPGVRIAVDAGAFARAGVALDRIRPYVDMVVVAATLPSRPDVAALVEASLLPGAERVRATTTAVDWQAVQAFVAQRATTVDVSAARSITAEEVVARHQARSRQQTSRIDSTIAHGTTTIMFEVPGFVAPVTITAETTAYARGSQTDIEQRDIRVNGAPIAGGSAEEPPRLPLLEPERIATPPLVIALTDAYAYELLGRESIDGADAFVIRFSGRDTRVQGRAWIDGRSFALRRLQVVQDGGRGPIVSSEQVQEFRTFPAERGDVELPTRTRVFQMYEGAGHRTPIHRDIVVTGYEINPAGFDARLDAAHASPHLMLRDTAAGLRYLLRRGGDDRAREETVAPDTVRTVVLGVLVDPNIADPLPFAGLSYVDLDVRNTGAQINVFFGGTYGQLSWSVPSVAGTRWQLHGRAFGIAVRYNDRAFVNGVERYEQNIRQRPAHVSVGAVRPLTARTRLRARYELDVTTFSRASSTAASFLVPASAIVHGAVLAVQTERGPWTLAGWWNPARRQGWRPWGSAAFDPAARDFQRYGASASRTLVLGPVLGSRIEAAWSDGHDLDRFSRYSFNSFDNRLHGYPTASIRYDRGFVARSATSWNGRGWRVDGFADMALVRDPGLGSRLRGYPGVGAALEAGGPFRTLLSVEWGYGFVMRTQAVRVTAYRVF